jgi:hypothetical protein
VIYGGAISGFGFWAGSRWERIEGIVRQGGLTLGLFVGIIGMIAFTTRWIVRHKARVERVLASWRQTPVLGALLGLGVTRSGRARPFISVLPPLGLAVVLLAGFAAAGLVDWSFFEASVIRRIQGADEAVVAVATAVGVAAIHPIVLVSLVVAVLAHATWSGWRPLALVAGSLGSTILLSLFLNGQIDRPFGPVDIELALAPNFPDAVMAAGAATIVSLAWPWKATWTRGTVRLGVAAVLVATFATARAVTVSAYPVDVIAGTCLGVAAVIATGIVLDRRLHRRLRTTPDPRGIGTDMPAAGVPAHERPAI